MYNPHDFFGEDATLEEVLMVLEELPEIEWDTVAATGYFRTPHGFLTSTYTSIGVMYMDEVNAENIEARMIIDHVRCWDENGSRRYYLKVSGNV